MFQGLGIAMNSRKDLKLNIFIIKGNHVDTYQQSSVFHEQRDQHGYEDHPRQRDEQPHQPADRVPHAHHLHHLHIKNN